MEGEIKTTTNHALIRSWAENRGGKPAKADEELEEDATKIIRIKFPEEKAEEELKEISWEEFLRIFEEKNLIFIFAEEQDADKHNRFHKFAYRKEYLSPAADESILPENEEEWIIEEEED